MFSYIANVWVCCGACHKDMKGQESVVETVDAWGQRNVAMSLAGSHQSPFVALRSQLRGREHSSFLCEPCIS